MLVNKTNSKQEITRLCNMLLDKNTNIAEIFYKLYSLVDDLPINEDLKNFCSLIVDETDWIPQEEKRKFCSEDFIKKINTEEQKILKFYKNDIKKVAAQIIKEVSEM